MKSLILLMVVYAIAFSFDFDIKDHPVSITYHTEGETETFTTTFKYDESNRLIEIENGLEYIDLTATYSQKGDTTIMRVVYDEGGSYYGKYIYDIQGRLQTLISCDSNMIPELKTTYYYDISGNIIREVNETLSPDLGFDDSITYSWDLANGKIVSRCYYEGEAIGYGEYEIVVDPKNETGP